MIAGSRQPIATCAPLGQPRAITAAWARAADARHPRRPGRRAAAAARVGVRGQVGRDAGRSRTSVRGGRGWSSRRGNDVTVAYPELAGIAAAHQDVLLDGEIVVLRGGVPSFAALAERMHVRDAGARAGPGGAAPATLIVFDVLRLYGVDLTARPWQERRDALERLGARADGVAALPRLRRRPGAAGGDPGAGAGGRRRQAPRARRTARARGRRLGQARAPAHAGGAGRRLAGRDRRSRPGRRAAAGAVVAGTPTAALRFLRYARQAGSGWRRRPGRRQGPALASVADQDLAVRPAESRGPTPLGTRWCEPRRRGRRPAPGAHRRRPPASARRPGVPHRRSRRVREER